MKKLVSFFLLAAILTSCAKDEDIPGSELAGTWEMTNYYAFLPSPTVLNANDVIWNFNLSSNKLTVTNNVLATYPYLLASGVYNIAITGPNVKIEDAVYTYRFDNGSLWIEIFAFIDAPAMKFRRK